MWIRYIILVVIICVLCTLSLSKVLVAENNDSLREIFQEEESIVHMTEAGYAKPLSLITVIDKKEVISTLLTFHLFIKVKAVMDQFQEGLAETGRLYYVEKYTDLMRPLFVNENPAITASKITDTAFNLIIIPCSLIILIGQIKGMFEVEYSEVGTTKRHAEEQTYIFF